MKNLKSIFLHLVMCGLAIGFLSVAQRALAIAENEAFPSSLTIKAYKTGVLDRQMLAGKVTVINFWATWCESCKVELVEMEEKFQSLLENKDFQLAFVSLDKDPDKAGGWLSGHLKKPDTFLNLLYKDPDFAAAETLGIDAFPMTLVISKDGVVRYIQKGFEEGTQSTEKIIDFAKKLLQ